MRLIVPADMSDAEVRVLIQEAGAKGHQLQFRIQEFINSKRPAAFIHGGTRDYDSDKTHDACCVCYLLTSTTTVCGHFVCRNCLRRWTVVEKRTSCPMCRQPIVVTA